MKSWVNWEWPQEVCGNGNMRDWVGPVGGGMEGRAMKEMSDGGSILVLGRNLVAGKQ